MSLTFPSAGVKPWFWLPAIGLSAALHIGFPAQILSQTGQVEPEPPQREGVTGAIMFDLSDIIAGNVCFDKFIVDVLISIDPHGPILVHSESILLPTL